MRTLLRSARLLLVGAVIIGTSVVGMSLGVANATPLQPQAQMHMQAAQEKAPCTAPIQGGPGADFRPGCAAHDACYAPTSSTDRAVCDSRLQADLREACRQSFTPPVGGESLYPECLSTADAFYSGVRSGGRGYYKGTGNPA